MKIMPVIILIIIITGLSFGYIYFDEPSSFRSSYSGKSGWFPFLILYNGSYSFVEDFIILNFEGREMGFYLTFAVSFPKYCDVITVNVLDEKDSYPYFPENPGEQKGIYIIKDLKLTQSDEINQYPFDEHLYKVSFSGIDYNLQFPRINENHSLLHWRLTVYGEGNHLNFSFSRVQEITSYRILKSIGIISCIFSIIACLSYFTLRDEKINYLKWGNFSFYLGVIVGIPFYFGMIVNLMLFYYPTLTSNYLLFLFSLLIISIVTGMIAFYFKQKISEKKIDELTRNLIEIKNSINGQFSELRDTVNEVNDRLELNNQILSETIEKIKQNIDNLIEKFPKRRTLLIRFKWKKRRY